VDAMNGRPVWLASISLRYAKNFDRIIGTGEWMPMERKEARSILNLALAGVGDMGRERGFRMCATACVHRALTDAEREALPPSWDDTPPDSLAGAPVEILWEVGPEQPLSTRPCADPYRLELPGQPHLYFPEDCKRCETCRARIEYRERAMRAWFERHPEARP